MTGEKESRPRDRWQRICAILDVVFDAPEAERERVLAERCANDPGLRAEVEELLAAEAMTDRRVDSPVADWAGDVLDDGKPAYSPGDAVGRHRLVRELGRGGMGTVWLAERVEDGFEHQVALKLLKRGLDTDAILRRFLDERRILARLRHPHIALFLDGGVSDRGQPWFTMEWIDGAPITQWCDARKQPVRERIALFLDVVEAVQYAHQQLVVHRDLKPGNVMVSTDGQVKLLDFGIAKVLDVTQGSAEPATLTRLGWRMLTPEYAAPEQLRGEPANTATDVYALGVLLYELLAGQRPLSRSAPHGLPQRPSEQITDEAAALRAGSKERVRRTLRGDLDTIVLKALHPESARRYGSAQAFGDDLRRWLDGQPVQARPDSAWYRTRRFVTRHRLGATAAAIVALSLAAGVLVATWQAREAQRQALEAKKQTLEAQKQAQRAEQVKDLLVKIVSQTNPNDWHDSKEPTMADVLDAGVRYVDQDLTQLPDLHAEMLVMLGHIYETRGQFDRAEALMRRSLEERRNLFGDAHEAYADSLYNLSSVLYEKGDWKGSQQAATQSAAILERRLGDDPRTAKAYEGMAYALQMGKDPDEAIRLRRRALEIYRRSEGERSEDAASVEQSLGLDLIDRGRYAEGEALVQQGLETTRELNGPRSLGYARALNAYAVALGDKGALEQSAKIYRQAASIFRGFADSGQVEIAVGNLGLANQSLGHFDEAEGNLREALDASRKGPKAGTRWEGRRLLGLADLLAARGRPDEAEPMMRRALTIMERDAGADHEWLPLTMNLLANLLIDQGRTKEAASFAERADGMLRQQFGPDDFRVALNQALLGRAQYANGDRKQGLQRAKGALRRLQRARGESWVTTTSAATGLAELQLQAGEWQQAEASLRQIADASDAKGYKPLAVQARMLRGAALMLLGRLQESEPVLRDALSQRQKMYGEDNAWTAEAKLYLGICLHRQGKTDEGRKLIGQGRAEFIRQFGPDHFVVRLADDEVASEHRASPRS